MFGGNASSPCSENELDIDTGNCERSALPREFRAESGDLAISRVANASLQYVSRIPHGGDEVIDAFNLSDHSPRG